MGFFEKNKADTEKVDTSRQRNLRRAKMIGKEKEWYKRQTVDER